MADPITVVPGQVVAGPDWDALVAQHGGTKGPPQLRQPSKQEQAAADDSGEDLQKNPIYRQYLGDDTYVEYRKAANGTDSQIVAYQPSQRYQQQQSQAQAQQQRQANNPPTTSRVEGTPTGQVDANGQPVYDNTRPVMVTHNAQTGEVIKSEPLTGPQREQWEKDKNGGLTDEQVRTLNLTGKVKTPTEGYPGTFTVTTKVGGNQETHYENSAGQTVPDPHPATNQPARATTPDKDHPGWTIVTTKDGQGNQETYYENPQGQRAVPPGATASKRSPDPNNPGLTIVTTKDENNNEETHYENAAGSRVSPPGKPTETYRDKDGQLHEILRNTDGSVKEDRIVPSGGDSGTSQGPSLPSFMVGHIGEALRTYAQQLNDEVAAGRMTSATRTNLWNQAEQAAQAAYNEATLTENARQSDMSAGVQLSTNRLSNATSTFNTALQVVNDLNGKLPVGSDLGGKAFMAILGLQFEHAKNMGAYDFAPVGGGPQYRPSQLPGMGGPSPSTSSAGPSPASSAAPSSAASPSSSMPQNPSTTPGAPPPESPVAPTAGAAPAPAPTADNPPPVPPKMSPHAAEGARWFIDPQTKEVRWITPAGDIHRAHPDGSTEVIESPGVAGTNDALYNSANAPAAPTPASIPTPAGSSSLIAPATPPSTADATPPDAPQAAIPPGEDFAVLKAMQPPPPVQETPASPGDFAILQNMQQPTPPPGLPMAPSAREDNSGLPLNQRLGQAENSRWLFGGPDYASMQATGLVAPQTPPEPGEDQLTPLAGGDMPRVPLGAPGADPTASVPIHPAVLHTMARTTPPWRLDNATIQQMLDAGVSPDVIFAVPGRATA